MREGKDGWLRCDIDRATLQSLQQRSNARGLLNLSLFLGPLVVVGGLAYASLGSLWALPLFWAYGSIYGFSISLLHETHHATPFRSRNLNNAMHTLAGLMTLRNPIYDRRMHTQHHGNTSVMGKDPELAHPKPIVGWKLVLDLFWLRAAVNLPILLVRQLLGIYSAEERKVISTKLVGPIRGMAAFILAFYVALVAGSIVYQTWLPLLFTYLAHIYGGFIPRLYALTQHLGLDQEVNDFRLNSRTCLYNPVAAAWYWNMNYHIEHHMFPLVPFHSLPKLHEALRSQMPPPNSSVIDAWREILVCLRHQRREPEYSISKQLPENG